MSAGLAIDMIRELATRLGYTYSFRQVEEAGRKVDKEWTGMLGKCGGFRERDVVPRSFTECDATRHSFID